MSTFDRGMNPSLLACRTVAVTSLRQQWCCLCVCNGPVLSLCRFIDALRQKLEAAFPETVLNVNNSEIDSLVHVHYKDFNYIVEYTPLLVTYFVLLLYIYFSVRKWRLSCTGFCHTHTVAQICTHINAHTHTHTHTHIHKHTSMHACTPPPPPPRTHTRTHVHVHIHGCMHAHS